jgi:hypothetical protein
MPRPRWTVALTGTIALLVVAPAAQQRRQLYGVSDGNMTHPAELGCTWPAMARTAPEAAS